MTSLSTLEQVYEQTLQALQISLSATSDRELRQSAGAFLEQLKASSADCMKVMLHILTQENEKHTSFIRQLAMSISNDWLKRWWNQISADDQGGIKNTFLLLLRSDAVGLSPTRSLRVNLSVALAGIAERQYPQQWTTFVDDMLAVWQSSPLERQEAVILCFEAVIVDCIDSDYSNSLPTQRRQDILAGFKLQLVSLFHTAYASLTDNCINYQKLIVDSDKNPASAVECGRIAQVANATVRMLRPFVSFIKVVEACKDPHDFTPLILGMLSLPGLQIEAAAFLQTITLEKLPLEYFVKLLQLIPASPVAVFPPDFGDCISFRRSYAEAVFSMLGQNIGQAIDPSFLAHEQAPQLLGQYVTLMANLMQNSSSRLAFDVIKDWIRIFKEPSISNLTWMTEVCHLVLGVYAVKAIRGVWCEGRLSPLLEMDAAEFDEYDDYCEFYGKFISQIRLLIDLMARKFPSVCAAFLRDKVAHNVSTYGTIVLKSDADSPLSDSDAVREWDATLISINVIFKSICIAEATAADPSLGPALMSIVEALLAWQIDSKFTPLVSMRIKAIQFSAPVMRFSQMHLLQAFSALIDQFSNKYASLAISYLCEKCSKEIASSNLINEFVPKLLQLLAHEGVTEHQRANMREAVVAISENVEENQRRTELLVAALGDMVEKWKEMSRTILATPQDLLQCSLNAGNGGGLEAVVTLLNSILTTSKKVALPRMPDEVWTHAMGFTMAELTQIFPFTPVWQEVLPGILVAIQSLHGLWAGDTRQQLAQQTEIAPIYLLTSKEINVIAGIAGETPQNGQSDPSADATRVIQVVRRELSELRSSLYQLIGQASSHKVLYTSPEHAGCLSSIASAMPLMENAHLTLLMLRFVEPYILNAPSAMHNAAAEFLTVFLQELLTRLSVAWDRREGAAAETGADGVTHFIYRHCSLPSSADGQGYLGIDAVTLEIVKEKIIGELTKAFSEVMASFGLCRSFLALSVPTDVPAAMATLGGGLPETSASGEKKPKKKGKGRANNPENQATGEGQDEVSAAEEQQRDRQKLARRQALQNLIMGADRASVTKPFVESILALLCIPDVDACKWGLALARGLSEQCAADNRLLVAVGRDCFTAALTILLKAEIFSAGMEWSLVEFLQDVYCGFVLGFPMGDMPSTAHFPADFCDLPRQVLLQVPGSCTEKVQELESTLTKTVTKKKRREHFKDFLKSLQQGATAEKSISSILNLQEKFLGSRKEKRRQHLESQGLENDLVSAAIDETDVLSNLFC